MSFSILDIGVLRYAPNLNLKFQLGSSRILFQNTVTRRKSGADLGYVYKEVVMVLISVIQQTPSLDKIILQTLRGGKPTRKLLDILSILLISIVLTQKNTTRVLLCIFCLKEVQN